jgi:hypothetical protein
MGTGTDPDGQTLAFHWVLVSRPAGSGATLSPANVDNVTLTPDVEGSYEVGLRVDDGMDNSPLFTRAFAVGPVAPTVQPASGGGGGGGCGISHVKTREGDVSPLSTVLIIFSPAAGIMIIRRHFIGNSR